MQENNECRLDSNNDFYYKLRCETERQISIDGTCILSRCSTYPTSNRVLNSNDEQNDGQKGKMGGGEEDTNHIPEILFFKYLLFLLYEHRCLA